MPAQDGCAADASAPVVSTSRPHDQAPTAIAARRSGSVQIDGRLDEAAWQAATPVTDFRQNDPHEGQPAFERTEARILIDDAAVYVGIRLYDSEPRKIQSQLARRDEYIEGMMPAVIFDSYHDHLSGFIFRVSASGCSPRRGHCGGWRRRQHWDPFGREERPRLARLERRVPHPAVAASLRSNQQIWGLQVVRSIARKAEESVFSFTPKIESHGVSRYGHLTGLGKLPSPRRLELVPYALAKNENPGVARNDPLRERNNIVPGVGLDLKYGLTSNFTLDATFNPDFGQVEVDPAVVNLSAFETFFPERRPFFVEGASIFSFGGMR